jgi:hypothetical protein
MSILKLAQIINTSRNAARKFKEEAQKWEFGRVKFLRGLVCNMPRKLF